MTIKISDPPADHPLAEQLDQRDSQSQKTRSNKRRPKNRGTTNVATLIAKELHSIVPVIRNGKRTKITKFQLIAKRAVDKALHGNFSPLIQMLELQALFERFNQPATESRFADVDLSKLSLEELVQLQRDAIASTKPLSDY